MFETQCMFTATVHMYYMCTCMYVLLCPSRWTSVIYSTWPCLLSLFPFLESTQRMTLLALLWTVLKVWHMPCEPWSTTTVMNSISGYWESLVRKQSGVELEKYLFVSLLVCTCDCTCIWRMAQVFASLTFTSTAGSTFKTQCCPNAGLLGLLRVDWLAAGECGHTCNQTLIFWILE